MYTIVFLSTLQETIPRVYILMRKHKKESPDSSRRGQGVLFFPKRPQANKRNRRMLRPRARKWYYILLLLWLWDVVREREKVCTQEPGSENDHGIIYTLLGSGVEGENRWFTGGQSVEGEGHEVEQKRRGKKTFLPYNNAKAYRWWFEMYLKCAVYWNFKWTVSANLRKCIPVNECYIIMQPLQYRCCSRFGGSSVHQKGCSEEMLLFSTRLWNARRIRELFN